MNKTPISPNRPPHPPPRIFHHAQTRAVRVLADKIRERIK